jgi:hypothetical protein
LRALLVLVIAAFTSTSGGLVAQGGLLGGGGQNDSEGDISSDTSQEGSAESGDAVGGQVVGVVSAGNTRVDATNRSEDVDVRSGDADAENCAAAAAGLVAADDFEVEGCEDAPDPGPGEECGQFLLLVLVGCGPPELSQEGEIERSSAQAALAGTGDAVGGQIIGVVTGSGGTTDVSVANTSLGIDAESGDATFRNDLQEFVGQQGEPVESIGIIGLDFPIGGLDFLPIGGLDFL